MTDTSVFIIKGNKAKQVENFINSLPEEPIDTSLYCFKSPNKKTNCYVGKDFTQAIDYYLEHNSEFFYKDIKSYLKKKFHKVDNVSLSGYLNHKNYYKKKYSNPQLKSTLTIWAKLS